jgi:hypothetical protein
MQPGSASDPFEALQFVDLAAALALSTHLKWLHGSLLQLPVAVRRGQSDSECVLQIDLDLLQWTQVAWPDSESQTAQS